MRIVPYLRLKKGIKIAAVRKFWDSSADSPAAAAAGTSVPVPAILRIGSVEIAPATVLAPMAGVTDTVFRRFIRNLGG